MTEKSTVQAGERTHRETRVRSGAIRERRGRFYIDTFHDVFEGGRCVDSFKYGHFEFRTRHAAEMFEWQHAESVPSDSKGSDPDRERFGI